MLRVQNKNVYEEANQFLCFNLCAIGDSYADYDVILICVAMQQNTEGGKQRHEQSNVFACAQRFERFSEFLWQ